MEKELNILYTCDNKFLDMTSVSIASVIENNKDRKIHFYIATESENSEYFNKIVDFYKNNINIKFSYLDCKKYDSLLAERGLDRWGSNSYYVYWKLFAYQDIYADYIWYLDSDVICLNEIENPKLSKEKSIGAVLDTSHAKYNKYAYIPDDYYFFNSGSMFIDINKWKRNNCEEKVVDYIKNFKHKPLMCDQDIIAQALQSDAEVLEPKYNYLSCYSYYGVENCFSIYSLNKKRFYKSQEIDKNLNDVIFYHCLGGVCGRPWEEDNFHPIKNTYQEYIKKSAFKEFKASKKSAILLSFQKFLEILPNSTYNKIHNLAQVLMLKSLRNRNK